MLFDILSLWNETISGQLAGDAYQGSLRIATVGFGGMRQPCDEFLQNIYLIVR